MVVLRLDLEVKAAVDLAMVAAKSYMAVTCKYDVDVTPAKDSNVVVILDVVLLDMNTSDVVAGMNWVVLPSYLDEVAAAVMI